MRRFMLAAMMFGAVTAAHAADLPDLPVLRGSYTDGLTRSNTNWQGFYAGGQVGYSSADMNFSNSVVTLTDHIFRNSVLQEPTSQWSLLGKNSSQGTNFGGFAGYNFQWDDIVVGVEANYNYMNNIASSSTGSLALNIVNPPGSAAPPNHTYTYQTSMDGAAAAAIKDVLTFRGRAGWTFGGFMPYMFGGLAVGRMDISRSVSTNVVRRDDQTVTTTDAFGNVTTTNLAPVFTQIPGQSVTVSEHKTNAFVAGWTAGLGFEYCLWGGLFMRGEYEYVKFSPIKDTNISLNSVRAGLGYKF
ncbi:porin family protein [Bradyrhizobium sp. WSM 1704]|uniref:outer membrane protein n=1 Tax=Bradyrhizobium semiaridum TaxID=2821404 RepID=UPI001CE303EF|nr:outer membrane beta-barrel protein [Bradyrhizobium semiaridum]MCA6123092.1 porin family protein [Bradyrhizobium semiaridum]